MVKTAATTDATVANGEKKTRAGKSAGKKAASKSSKSGSNGEGKPTRPHRFRPGTQALRAIRRYQKSTDLLLRKLPFQRLVHEVAQKHQADLRFQASAVATLQEATEMYLVGILENANLVSLHAKRQTVDASDVKLARQLCA